MSPKPHARPRSSPCSARGSTPCCLPAAASRTTLPHAASDNDPPQPFASGTRLKAHYLDGGGGARKLLAFHDSLLDIECQFVETAPGQYACLPTSSTRTFSDSDCLAATFPAAGLCPGDPLPSAGQLISAAAADCSAQFGAYSLNTLQGEAAQTPSFFLTVYGNCWSPPSQAAQQAHWTTKPEPLARFVQGALSTIGAATGIQAKRVRGEDGAFTTLELVAADTACTPIPFEAVERCVPRPLAQTYAGSYADPSCTDARVALVGTTIEQQCAGVQPQYLVESTSNNCREASAIYALGDSLSQVFANVDSCRAINLSNPGYSGDSFYRIGASVSAAVLPVAHSTQLGTGMIRVGYYTDSTGAPILARAGLASRGEWALTDGKACTVANDPSGQPRCVHDALIVGTADHFADSSCTEPVYTDEFGCAPRAFAYIANIAFDRCSTKLTQTYLAKIYAGPRYSTESGSCQPDPYSPPNPYFALGDPIDDAVFPLITDTTDP